MKNIDRFTVIIDFRALKSYCGTKSSNSAEF